MFGQQPSPFESEPYDETAWMATVIELLAVVAAVLFALVEAH
jgi:hypothetical protein